MAAAAQRVLFLPGASGDGRFWQPVAERLPVADKVLVDFPGLGNVPHDPTVRGFEDLVALVLRRIDDRPVDLVAQSMGGVVAVRVTLERPDLVRRLVLVATSGGIDLTPFKPRDWRPEYRQQFPNAAPWIMDHRVDLSQRLPEILQPTLLLWSDGDEISPVAVGGHLSHVLPHAELIVLGGGDHAFARDRADRVAPHVERHLFG